MRNDLIEDNGVELKRLPLIYLSASDRGFWRDVVQYTCMTRLCIGAVSFAASALMAWRRRERRANREFSTTGRPIIARAIQIRRMPASRIRRRPTPIGENRCAVVMAL